MNIWEDAVKENHFEGLIKKQLKNVFTSNFEEHYIEETLFTSKYILDITCNWLVDYEIKDWIPIEWYSYYISVYENEEQFEKWEDYNGWGLVILPEEEKYSEKLINEKYDYIVSFI